MGLPWTLQPSKAFSAELDLAEGASVIITNNLTVEHGVMNGTHGHVTRIICTHHRSPLS